MVCCPPSSRFARRSSAGMPPVYWIGLCTVTSLVPVSYTHLRAHETDSYLVCRLLLEKKKEELNTTDLETGSLTLTEEFSHPLSVCPTLLDRMMN